MFVSFDDCCYMLHSDINGLQISVERVISNRVNILVHLN